MTYTKPNVLSTRNATFAVQNGDNPVNKHQKINPDSAVPSRLSTSGAYQADE
jgi:hypothetical protein